MTKFLCSVMIFFMCESTSGARRLLLLAMISIVAMACQATAGTDDLITLTNAQGQSIQCQVEGYRDDKVAVRLENGKFFRVPFATLDETSQRAVRRAILLRERLTIKTSQRGSKRSLDHFLRVNLETDNPFEEQFRMRVFFIGRPQEAQEKSSGGGSVAIGGRARVGGNYLTSVVMLKHEESTHLLSKAQPVEHEVFFPSASGMSDVDVVVLVYGPRGHVLAEDAPKDKALEYVYTWIDYDRAD